MSISSNKHNLYHRHIAVKKNETTAIADKTKANLTVEDLKKITNRIYTLMTKKEASIDITPQKLFEEMNTFGNNIHINQSSENGLTDEELNRIDEIYALMKTLRKEIFTESNRPTDPFIDDAIIQFKN